VWEEEVDKSTSMRNVKSEFPSCTPVKSTFVKEPGAMEWRTSSMAGTGVAFLAGSAMEDVMAMLLTF
jgi:hypothetical protein